MIAGLQADLPILSYLVERSSGMVGYGGKEREGRKEREDEVELDSANQILLAMYVKWKRRLVVDRRRNGAIIVGRFGAAPQFLVHR